MLTFKQYIAEKWVRGTQTGEKRLGKDAWVTHIGNVEGHHVEVEFFRSPSERKKRNKDVSIGFTVDHSYDKQDLSNNTHGAAILNHVNKIVSHYIKRRKPNSVSLMGNTTSKQKLYDKYAESIAKKFGAHASYGIISDFKHSIRGKK